MAITPQAIKDQEFQVKFRGYDAIEVKAYLELLAEEFFELNELQRQHEDESVEIKDEYQALVEENERLLQQTRQQEEGSDEVDQVVRSKDDEITALNKKIAELESVVEDAQLEKSLQQEAAEKQEGELRAEIEGIKGLLQNEESSKTEASKEIQDYRNHIEQLEKQLTELRQEDVDFKSTIIAAQKFSEDLRQKAEKEAEAIMKVARDNVEQYKKEAQTELSKLPIEIEQLRQKKTEVRDELRGVLHNYIEQLDGMAEAFGVDGEDNLSDLFQSISIGEDETVDPSELDSIVAEES